MGTLRMRTYCIQFVTIIYCLFPCIVKSEFDNSNAKYHGVEPLKFIEKYAPWLQEHVEGIAQQKYVHEEKSEEPQRNILDFLLAGYPGVSPAVQDLLRNDGATSTSSLIPAGILQAVQENFFQMLHSGELQELFRRYGDKRRAHESRHEESGERRRYRRALPLPTKPAPPGFINEDKTMDPNCEADMDTYLRPITSLIIYVVSLVMKDNNMTLPHSSLWPDIHDYIVPFPGWGISMYDSNFKLPPGVLQGNWYWVGSQEECNSVSVTYNYTSTNNTIIPRTFDGNYCRVNLLTELTNGTYWPLDLGICFPDSCDEGNITEYFTNDNLLTTILFKLLELNIPNIYCGMETDSAEDNSLLAALIIGGIFLLLIIMATIYDGGFRHKIIHRRLWRLHGAFGNYRYPVDDDDERVDLKVDAVHNYLHGSPSFAERLEVIVAGFSLYTNLRDIFKPTPSKKNHDPIIDGLRSLSFIYFMLGMTWVVGPVLHLIWTTANLIDALQTWPKDFAFQIIINAYCVNYTFMFLCGYLATLWWYRVKETWERGFTICQLLYTMLWFIFRKYWSLVPAIMMSLMLLTTSYSYLAYGSTFPVEIPGVYHCYTYWWEELALVVNFIEFKYQCMGWLFFICVIYQVYVSSVLILVPLIIRPSAGYTLLVLFYIANILILAAMCGQVYDGELSFIKDVLGRPWSSCGPYLFGIAMAIMYSEEVFATARVPTAVNLLLWLVALLLFTTVTFTTYTATEAGGMMAGQWSRSQYIAYFTLSPTAWSLALCWVIASCHMGCAGVVYDLLCWGGFRVIARLTFASLILSSAVLSLYFYQQYTLIYISRLNMNYLFFGQFCITTLIGLIVALWWERPLSRGPLFAFECKTRLEALRYGRHPPLLELPSASGPSAKGKPMKEPQNYYVYASDDTRF